MDYRCESYGLTRSGAVGIDLREDVLHFTAKVTSFAMAYMGIVFEPRELESYFFLLSLIQP